MARFLHRGYPSANTVLLDDILVDPGATAAPVLAWLAGRRPALVVNTHWHSDHAGANAAFQALGTPIALPAPEAARVNARDPDACRAWWLHQTVAAFTADRALHPGEDLAGWRVVALPGHNATQIGLHRGDVLLCGDAMTSTDVGWLDLDADPAALDQAETTIEAIAALDLRLVLPGHGPAIDDPPAALARARRRLASWRADPERIGWHACKRIFTHELIISGGLAHAAVAPYLLGAPWFHDHAARAFGVTPEAFVPLLLAEMLRSGAARTTATTLMPAGRDLPPET